MLNALIVSVALLLLPSEWLTHTDAADLYSLKYPGFWEKTVNEDSVTLFSKPEGASDGFRENVNIRVKDLKKAPITMTEYTEATKEWLIASGGTLQFERIIQFAGQTAIKVVYKLPAGVIGIDMELMLQQIWIIKDSKSYLLTYAAEPGKYEKYEQVANIIFNSFTLK